MTLKPLPQRKSPRLQGYDYSQEGAYFVTICAHQRKHLFGAIEDGEMVLNDMGQVAFEDWNAIPDHFPGIELDAFVVMPKHVHGIVVIVGTAKNPAKLSSATVTDKASLVPTRISRSGSLSAVVGSYKSGVTRRIREMSHNPELTVWQGRYHDHIIRSDKTLDTIRDYVANNPSRWEEDTFFNVL